MTPRFRYVPETGSLLMSAESIFLMMMLTTIEVSRHYVIGWFSMGRLRHNQPMAWDGLMGQRPSVSGVTWTSGAQPLNKAPDTDSRYSPTAGQTTGTNNENHQSHT